MVQTLNDAMDLGDAAKMKTVLRVHAEQYPDDPNQLQAGYEIIARCLDHLDAAAKAAAQRYYDQELGSTLRVFVERHCLLPRN